MPKPSEGFRFRCREYGDAALLVEAVAPDYEARWAAVQGLGRALRDSALPGIVDVVASYENVFVSFDPLVVTSDEVRNAIASFDGQPSPRQHQRRIQVPVVYGGEFGPDLDAVAADLSVSAEEVVALHTSSDWMVRFVASPAGAPMMDGPPIPRRVPRMHEPRQRIAPGSIGMSGRQSIIYTVESPGGWRLIGRTPALLFNLDEDPPVVYRPGDAIRFVPITAAEWSDGQRPLRVEEGAP